MLDNKYFGEVKRRRGDRDVLCICVQLSRALEIGNEMARNEITVQQRSERGESASHENSWGKNITGSFQETSARF